MDPENPEVSNKQIFFVSLNFKQILLKRIRCKVKVSLNKINSNILFKFILTQTHLGEQIHLRKNRLTHRNFIIVLMLYIFMITNVYHYTVDTRRKMGYFNTKRTYIKISKWSEWNLITQVKGKILNICIYYLPSKKIVLSKKEICNE